MAPYARRDAARAAREREAKLHRVRIARPKRGGVPALGFAMYGQITLATTFVKQVLAIDPLGESYLPEHKQIVGVDGWLSVGEVTVSWTWNDGIFYPDHVITAGEEGASNRIMFDGRSGRPTPFIVEIEALLQGEWIRPEVSEEPGSMSFDINCVPLIESVPR